MQWNLGMETSNKQRSSRLLYCRSQKPRLWVFSLLYQNLDKETSSLPRFPATFWQVCQCLEWYYLHLWLCVFCLVYIFSNNCYQSLIIFFSLLLVTCRRYDKYFWDVDGFVNLISSTLILTSNSCRKRTLNISEYYICWFIRNTADDILLIHIAKYPTLWSLSRQYKCCHLEDSQYKCSPTFPSLKINI